jgi:glycosyltransferase 2 family protein
MLVSAGILAYLLSSMDLKGFYKEFSHVRLEILPGLVFLMIVSNILRALRWRILLPSKGHISTRSLFEGVIVGYTATFLLPLRAGEFVRAFYISKIEDVSFSGAFASVVTERVFDIVTMLALLGCCIGMIPSIPPIVSIGAKTLGLLVLAIVALMVVAYRAPRLLLALAYRSSRIISGKLYSSFCRKIVGMTREFILGLQAIRTMKDFILVLLLSAGTWLSFCLFYWLSLTAMGAEGSLLIGGVVTSIIALAIAAPSAPGFLGTYQAGCVISLSTIFGMTQSFSIAYSVVTHLLQATVIIALGLFFLARRGLKLAQLTRRN